VAFAPNRD